MAGEEMAAPKLTLCVDVPTASWFRDSYFPLWTKVLFFRYQISLNLELRLSVLLN